MNAFWTFLTRLLSLGARRSESSLARTLASENLKILLHKLGLFAPWIDKNFLSTIREVLLTPIQTSFAKLVLDVPEGPSISLRNPLL